MSMVGADTWMPPTQELLDKLKHIQLIWYGGYIGGRGVFLNTPWPKQSWHLLRKNMIAPLPIYSPLQTLSGENPVECAREAMLSCLVNGMVGCVVLHSELAMSTVLGYREWMDEFVKTITNEGWSSVVWCGSRYQPPGSFGWWPEWGEAQLEPTGAMAIQYGPHKAFGVAINADNCGDAFPFAQWKGELEESSFLDTKIAGAW